ncbi:MAG TPA: hypothetical protein VGF28_12340 [Thermoanaerobaculia bacterium]|jgi:hypothetical protein
MLARSGGVLLLLISVIPALAQPRRIQADAPPLTSEALALLEELRVRADGCNIAGNISCGQSVSGTASACNTGQYYLDFWIFNGIAGQPVTAVVTNASTIYDVLVAVQDFGGTGEVLKSTVSRGSATLTFTPSVSKQYSVTVGYVTPFYSRSYNLAFTCGGGASCQSSGFLQRGVATTGSLTTTNGCNTATDNWTLFQFAGTGGVPVRIQGTAAFPLYMEANSVGAKTGTFKVDDPADSGFVYYPETTGVQELWVSHDGPKATGQFTVTITDEPLDPCRRRSVRH